MFLGTPLTLLMSSKGPSACSSTVVGGAGAVKAASALLLCLHTRCVSENLSCRRFVSSRSQGEEASGSILPLLATRRMDQVG